MKIHLFSIVFPLAASLLTGCGAPSPRDFGSTWQPVNHLFDKPQQIPLSPAYPYYAAPMDNTLRGMLRRWAKDNAMPLVWQLNSDYTLYKAVANLHAIDLPTAVSELNKIYAAQGILITVDPERILVQSAPAPGASLAPVASTAPVAPAAIAPAAAPVPQDPVEPAVGAQAGGSAAEPPISDD
jgi:hypothetical protein